MWNQKILYANQFAFIKRVLSAGKKNITVDFLAFGFWTKYVWRQITTITNYFGNSRIDECFSFIKNNILLDLHTYTIPAYEITYLIIICFEIFFIAFISILIYFLLDLCIDCEQLFFLLRSQTFDAMNWFDFIFT